MLVEKICKGCGKTFKADNNHRPIQVYHSRHCASRNVNRKPPKPKKKKSYLIIDKLTGPERKYYNQLIEENIDFEIQYKIKRYKVDFYIPKENKVIEVYGDYWHCNPKKYDPDYYNSSLEKTARKTWEYDKKRLEKIQSLGYEVEVIWESDIT